METHTYWRKQTPGKPLFPDIEWSKPERRDQAGKLLIVGGNKLGFAGVAEAYSAATEVGVGNIRTILPKSLKGTLPSSISDIVYAPDNSSGSLAKEAMNDLMGAASWADGVLLIGDAGRNSETAVLYESFVTGYQGPITITRDAVDLVKNSSHLLVDRPDTLLVVSFAQLQKLFQAVYFPKILTFSMQLMQLVEAVHKFTITYPITILVLHKDHLVIAQGGEVITQAWDNPMAIWRGVTAARAASYWLWNSSQPLTACVASIV